MAHLTFEIAVENRTRKLPLLSVRFDSWLLNLFQVGEVLDVKCVSEADAVDEGDACETFEIVPRPSETDHDIFRGSVVLRKSLDYRRRQGPIL